MNEKRKVAWGLAGVKRSIGRYLRGYINAEPAKGELAARAGDTVKRAAKGICAGLAGFVLGLGECAFGSRPFGVALLCASGEYSVFVYAGLATSALFVKGMAIPLFLTWSFAFMLRVAIGLWRAKDAEAKSSDGRSSDGKAAEPPDKPASLMFSERMAYRVACALGSGALIAVYRVISGGFLYYDAFGGLLDLLVTPFMTVMFSFALLPAARYSARFEVGALASVSAVILSLRAYNPLGFSLSNVLAFVFTLCVALTGGALRGGVAGLIAGAACGVAFSDGGDAMSRAAIFGLAGIAAGALKRWGRTAAIPAAAVTGIAGGLLAGGVESIITLAPDILGGTLIFAPLSRSEWLPRLMLYSNTTAVADSRSASETAAERARAAQNARLEAMSASFHALSEVFYTLSDRLRRPGIDEVGRVCGRAFDESCESCEYSGSCALRGSVKPSGRTCTDEAVESAARKLYGSGRVETDELPDEFERCPEASGIVDRINSAYGKLLGKLISQDTGALLAADYGVTAGVLTDAVTSFNDNYAPDLAGGERVREAARCGGVFANNIAAYGTRRKCVIAGGVDITRGRLTADELSRAFGAAVGAELGPPAYSFDGDYVTMTLTSRRTFEAECAKASAAKEGESLCGDSAVSFINREDYFYALISDGMGSGREAALTSRMTRIILEKMLEAGNGRAPALKLAGNYIHSACARSETFATIDLLEIDLLNGEAVFVKGGAAASFIVRGGRMFKIVSNSMPIGITREITAEEIRTKLEDGDLVVMVSDGVAQSFEETIMLASFLTGTLAGNPTPDELADKILEYARRTVTRSDDATAAVVRVRAV